MASSSIFVKTMRGKLNFTSLIIMFYYYYFCIFITNFKYSSATKLAPALFVFGDSLVDVGNNNHLPFTIAKADFPHNGVDFPTHKPTGRFSNGKNAADFLAEKLGLLTSPPYLSLTHTKSSNFSSGVSFASGGAGIFDGTDQLYHQSITFNKQIEYYGIVQGKLVQQLGQAEAEKLLSKSIFAIVIGSNDILGYFGSSSSSQKKKGIPQQYRMYDFGARKFVIFGVAAVGCCPSQRDRNKTDACNEAANFWASKYNKGVQSILQQYQTQLKDFKYSLFDTYTFFLNLIQQPATYGFKEEKSACCGLGNLNAKFACTPISTYCSNRSDHIFWDLYHPTEAAARLIVGTAFDGPRKYSFPVNVKQLVSV
ncbi:hypothetical protein RDABS01_032972 [Bienertia sinuspersici]